MCDDIISNDIISNDLALEDAVEHERERCAKIAYEYAKEIGEPTIGHAIAQKIRNSSE